MRTATFRIAIALVTFLIGICVVMFWAFGVRKELTKQEATKRFEEFVAENGYTDLPPTEDESKLVPEPFGTGVDAEGIKYRRNTLERMPDQVTKGNRLFKDGWTAFFFYKQPCQYCRPHSGRIIYMDAYGENLRVEHQDVISTSP